MQQRVMETEEDTTLSMELEQAGLDILQELGEEENFDVEEFEEEEVNEYLHGVTKLEELKQQISLLEKRKEFEKVSTSFDGSATTAPQSKAQKPSRKIREERKQRQNTSVFAPSTVGDELIREENLLTQNKSQQSINAETKAFFKSLDLTIDSQTKANTEKRALRDAVLKCQENLDQKVTTDLKTLLVEKFTGVTENDRRRAENYSDVVKAPEIRMPYQVKNLGGCLASRNNLTTMSLKTLCNSQEHHVPAKLQMFVKTKISDKAQKCVSQIFKHQKLNPRKFNTTRKSQADRIMNLHFLAQWQLQSELCHGLLVFLNQLISQGKTVPKTVMSIVFMMIRVSHLGRYQENVLALMSELEQPVTTADRRKQIWSTIAELLEKQCRHHLATTFFTEKQSDSEAFANFEGLSNVTETEGTLMVNKNVIRSFFKNTKNDTPSDKRTETNNKRSRAETSGSSNPNAHPKKKHRASGDNNCTICGNKHNKPCRYLNTKCKFCGKTGHTHWRCPNKNDSNKNSSTQGNG